MTVIVVETRIAASIEVVFDLARDVEMHLKTASSTGERAVGGKTSGLLELNDIVTFEAVHFGIRQRLTARIVELDRPRRFVDEMVKGAFASLRHVHEFFDDGTSVLMRDTLIWRSPLGFLGAVADKLFVERHMRAFMVEKQLKLKECAEYTLDTLDEAEHAEWATLGAQGLARAYGDDEPEYSLADLKP
jgi:ligand-binding SRPBCC domain-containing protein